MRAPEGLSESQLVQQAERVYAAYPRKAARGSGVRASARAIHVIALRSFGGDTAQAASWLVGRVAAYAGSGLVASSEARYIPYPSTWMNQGRYDDPPEAWAAVDARANGKPRALTTEQADAVRKEIFG